jgi:hypothetical protein
MAKRGASEIAYSRGKDKRRRLYRKLITATHATRAALLRAAKRLIGLAGVAAERWRGSRYRRLADLCPDRDCGAGDGGAKHLAAHDGDLVSLDDAHDRHAFWAQRGDSSFAASRCCSLETGARRKAGSPPHIFGRRTPPPSRISAGRLPCSSRSWSGMAGAMGIRAAGVATAMTVPLATLVVVGILDWLMPLTDFPSAIEQE